MYNESLTTGCILVIIIGDLYIDKFITKEYYKPKGEGTKTFRRFSFVGTGENYYNLLAQTL